MASAGCVGELCAFLSDEELKSVMLQHILGLYFNAKLLLYLLSALSESSVCVRLCVYNFRPAFIFFQI